LAAQHVGTQLYYGALTRAGCPICNPARSNRLGQRPRLTFVFAKIRSNIKHQERVMKSLITGGLLVASLALTGSTAMAANIPVHKHAPAVRHLVQRLPQGQANGDIGQFFQSIFGGQPVQYSRLTARASRQSPGSYDSSPSYDNSPAVDTSSADAQAMQSMNDENALNASTAAAEAQNEAAQAAAIQTEINANNQ
jgi:hypothetical protein